METGSQRPVKHYNYKVDYWLVNGDFEDAIISEADEAKVAEALEILNSIVSPSSTVARITIKIGDKSDVRVSELDDKHAPGPV